MKTTDIYVEQVLMGLLVLLTVGLFALDHWPEFSGSAKDIALTFGVLGAAYLLGILYDRFADTLLQNLEQHGRLAIAIERAEHKDCVSSAEQDPFPEQKLRIAVLEAAPGVARSYDYLRSRIRLARALATILPALSVALAVFLIGRQDGKTRIGLWSGVATALVYLWVFILNLLELPRKPPKTEAWRSYKYERDKNKWWHFQTAIQEPSLIGTILLFGFLVYIACASHNGQLMLMAPAGLLATFFATWAWYRINWTQLTLLHDYDNYKARAK